ncbi:MAG TPA: sensor domain-containing diguanylate cyclase [Bdellovibrionota bacterium]|nr:sensor domain-containing diguanylate cyclase [Bdellovibrionota bacterium]
MAPPDSTNRPSRQANYWDLFERLRDPTFLLDPETFVIRDANDACETVLGRAPDTLIGKPLLELVTDRERPAMEKSLRVARRRYYPVKFESRWSTVSGKELIMDIAACALALQDQREVIQIISHDMTGVREAEHKMQSYLLELSQLNRKLEELSITDELTGLANVRCFKGQLEQEHQRALRYNTIYSVIFCDVDNFKHYNDRNGHPAGDQVLRGVADVIRRACRTTDLAARYGGEEFVVLCPGVDEVGAHTLAERIRERVEQSNFPFGEHQPMGKVTLSLGVAHFPSDRSDPSRLLKAADIALYESKHGGRNRVTVFSGLSQDKKKAA